MKWKIYYKENRMRAFEMPDRCHECDNIANRVYFLCEKCQSDYDKELESARSSSLPVKDDSQKKVKFEMWKVLNKESHLPKEDFYKWQPDFTKEYVIECVFEILTLERMPPIEVLVLVDGEPVGKEEQENNFSQDEKIIAEIILEARKVQEFIWGELSMRKDKNFNKQKWLEVFQKRINKICELDTDHPHYKVELRKRILQQAALSVGALKLLQDETPKL